MATFNEEQCKMAIREICDHVEKSVESFKGACDTVADSFDKTGTAAGGAIGAAVQTAYTNYVEQPFSTLQASLGNFKERLDTVVANTVSGVSELASGLTSTDPQILN